MERAALARQVVCADTGHNRAENCDDDLVIAIFSSYFPRRCRARCTGAESE